MALRTERETVHPRDRCYAWFVCLCSFFGFMVSFGSLNSFGVFLPVWSKEFKTSKGETAWIGSITSGLIFLLVPFAIQLNLKYGERIGGVCGSLAIAGLLLASSFASTFLVLFITHGIFFGIFICIVINAFLFVIKKWFVKNLGLALGMAIAGGSVGTMVFNPLMQTLNDTIGWRDAIRTSSGIWTLTAFLCIPFTPNVEQDDESEERCQRASRNIFSNFIDCSLWTNADYVFGLTVIWTTFVGYYVAMIHVISFAKDSGIPGSKASLLFTIIGGFSTISRVALGKINDKDWLSSILRLQVSAFMIGSSLVLLTQAKEYYHFILFAVYYGIGNGAFISMQNYFLMTCFGDAQKDAVGYGMGQTVKSVPIIVGPPIAGFLADHFKSYVPAFYIIGSFVLVCSALPLCFQIRRKKPDRTAAHIELVGKRLASTNCPSLADISVV